MTDPDAIDWGWVPPDIPDGVTWTTTCPSVPTQSEGTIDGESYYFHARFSTIRLGVGGDPVARPEWQAAITIPGEFTAGMLSAAEIVPAFLALVALYRGRPDEAPEDPDSLPARIRGRLAAEGWEA